MSSQLVLEERFGLMGYTWTEIRTTSPLKLESDSKFIVAGWCEEPLWISWIDTDRYVTYSPTLNKWLCKSFGLPRGMLADLWLRPSPRSYFSTMNCSPIKIQYWHPLEGVQKPPVSKFPSFVNVKPGYLTPNRHIVDYFFVECSTDQDFSVQIRFKTMEGHLLLEKTITKDDGVAVFHNKCNGAFIYVLPLQSGQHSLQAKTIKQYFKKLYKWSTSNGKPKPYSLASDGWNSVELETRSDTPLYCFMLIEHGKI